MSRRTSPCMNKTTLILSPYSRNLRTLGQNAKNYPYWSEVISGLVKLFPIKVLQVCYKSGDKGLIETKVHPDVDYLFFSSVHDLVPYLRMPSVWASVDNFFPHLCSAVGGLPGVVIFSKSDPDIFGYKTNINLHSCPPRFRPDQFNLWEDCAFDEEAFPAVPEVIGAIKSLILQRFDGLRT